MQKYFLWWLQWSKTWVGWLSPWGDGGRVLGPLLNGGLFPHPASSQLPPPSELTGVHLPGLCGPQGQGWWARLPKLQMSFLPLAPCPLFSCLCVLGPFELADASAPLGISWNLLGVPPTLIHIFISHRTQEMRCSLPWCLHFKEMAPRFLIKIVPV